MKVIPPTDSYLDNVHLACVEMAASGNVTSSRRTVFSSGCKQLIDDEKVDVIILGGTDLVLVCDDLQRHFPLVNCAAIHVNAMVQIAT